MRGLTLLSSALTVALLAAPALAQYGRDSNPRRGNPPPMAPPAGAPAGAPQGDKPEGSPTSPGEARFYEKLDPADREALQANVGYRVAAPIGQLDWIGGDAIMADDFRGHVTVIQSMSSKSGGRGLLEKVKKALPEGVRMVALHTPESADRASAVFAINPPCLIAVDTSGDWCDALGVWKRPVNIVVDKTGAVRYVGLSDAGLRAKLPALLEEFVDDSVVAKPKPSSTPTKTETGPAPTTWPTFTNAVGSAADMRGQKLPQFIVQKWVTRQPDPAGRLIAIDFWATWCGPCKAAIPHVNQLSNAYGNDVLFVGVSDEKPNDFERGMQKSNLKENDFQYALALDPAARMSKFFQIKGIPHMAILGPDLTVRWQGHPSQLQDADLKALIEANKALTKVPAKPGNQQRGWKSNTSPKKS